MSTQSSSTQQSQNSLTSDALSEASEASLDELMNRAPALTTEAEIEKIISALRAQRSKFAQAEAAPKPKKSPRRKGPIISADELLNAIDLDF